MKDPAVNTDPNNPNFIPVIYAQPNILTSRATGTYVSTTRAASPRTRTSRCAGARSRPRSRFAGLGGDVRTYSPQISYTQYYPVRRKGRDQQPEVFGFRLVAGAHRELRHLAGSQGLAVARLHQRHPDLRALLPRRRVYDPRLQRPLDQPRRPARHVRHVAQRRSWRPTPPGTRSRRPRASPRTSPTSEYSRARRGNNPAQLSRAFTSVGGDTQLLGNFEYRIPLFGPVTLAAFADIGSAFNLRTGGDQGFSSGLPRLLDVPADAGAIPCRGIARLVTLNTLAACQNNSPLALSQLSGGLILRDNRLISQEEFINALRVGPVDPISGLPVGMQQVFLRGEAQTNTVVRNSQSVFSKFSDFRSSIGLEARFQVPIINVPFRLIYAYNPNARRGFVDELPGIFFNEKRNVFRFSVGRTF